MSSEWEKQRVQNALEMLRRIEEFPTKLGPEFLDNEDVSGVVMINALIVDISAEISQHRTEFPEIMNRLMRASVALLGGSRIKRKAEWNSMLEDVAELKSQLARLIDFPSR